MGRRRFRRWYTWWVVANGDPWIFWGIPLVVLALAAATVVPYGLGYAAPLLIACSIGRHLRAHPVKVPERP